MSFEKFIGRSVDPRTAPVERGMLRLFTTAVGETNRYFTDDAWMKSQGYPGVMVPSTYLQAVKLGVLPALEFMLMAGVEVDIGKTFHAEERFIYRKKVFAGDTLTFVETLTDIYQKKNGELTFYVGDTAVTNQHGDDVGEVRCVTVVVK